MVLVLLTGSLGRVDAQDRFFSDLGMDDSGRRNFCRILDAFSGDDEDVNILCEGKNRRTIVVRIKNAAPILPARVPYQEVLAHMQKPYQISLQRLDGLALAWDSKNRRLASPVANAVISDRLKGLGAVTIGDFYAACGFQRFVVRDAQTHAVYLNLIFDPRYYGDNPVLDDTVGAPSSQPRGLP